MGLDGIFGKLAGEVDQALNGGSRTKEPPAEDGWTPPPGGVK